MEQISDSNEKTRTFVYQFEQQIEYKSNIDAVVDSKGSLTYEQLNRRANRIAYYLQSLGVRPEVVVGLCMERSIDLVVGMLSILKAGGVYVPLEPAYPSERLTFILQDSGAQFLLTQKHLQHLLAAATVPVIALEDEVFADYPTSNPSSGLLSHNQMYRLYTSGSTGLPKGVMIEHYAVQHLFQSLRQVIYAPLFPASEQPLRVALN